LCDAIDLSFDDRISLEEIHIYVNQKNLPISEKEINDMFNDAVAGRGVTTEKERWAPLTHQEVAACVRGRHKWNR
jgi:hypothetical protein